MQLKDLLSPFIFSYRLIFKKFKFDNIFKYIYLITKYNDILSNR